jgi:hypothetical protein
MAVAILAMIAALAIATSGFAEKRSGPKPAKN